MGWLTGEDGGWTGEMGLCTGRYLPMLSALRKLYNIRIRRARRRLGGPPHLRGPVGDPLHFTAIHQYSGLPSLVLTRSIALLLTPASAMGGSDATANQLHEVNTSRPAQD